MTEDEINALKPGIELDELIAVHVLGRRFRVAASVVCPTCENDLNYCICGSSTDIIAAWRVVDKLAERYHWEIRSPFEPGKHWYVGLTSHGCSGWNGRADYRMIGDTAPLAICRVALLEALGEPQL